MKDSQNSKKKKKFVRKTNKPVSPPVKKTATPSKFKFSKFPSVGNLFRDVALLLIPVTLFGVFFVLHLMNEQLTEELTHNQLASFPRETKVYPYPLVDPPDSGLPLLNLSAKSAIIIDSDSQVVLFSKNPELRFSMASTAKIMTALTALSYYKLDAILTIKTLHTEGSILGLTPGDFFYFEDLLYAMLLPSSNDAAVAIADNYPGGKEAFVAKMNEKAKTLHLTNTHFSDSTGLDDDGDYTTVTDMSRLASYAIQNKEFAKVTSTKQKLVTNLDKSKQYPVSNLNKLLGTSGVTGIKTGTTEGAKEVLVTSIVANGHTFIIVVMNSEDRFGDTGMLLNFIAQRVQFVNPSLINK